MATKEVIIIDPNELTAIKATPAALDAYLFAVKNAGVDLKPGSGEEADFIQRRNNKSGWRDLWELKTMLEKAAASIKEVVKHTFNVGDWDSLPEPKENDGVRISWSKQSWTYEWQDDAGPHQVVHDLIEKGLVSVEQLVQLLTVANIAKAAGITGEKLMDMFPQYICAKAKERTLSIK